MKFLPFISVGALAFAMVLPGIAGADDRDATGGMKPSRVLQAVLSDSDKNFFETAASANMLEIQASRLAEQRAVDPADKKFAKQMIKDHGKAGDELEALAKKKGVALPTVLLKRHQMMLDDLKGEKAGKEFDEEYRDKMVESHKEAVSLFDEVAGDSKDPEIKAFAAKMLPTLKAHGGMAEELPKKG